MFVSFNLRSLDGLKQSRGGLARRFPARRVAGGREKVGGNGEEVEPHLMVVLACRERAGGGGEGRPAVALLAGGDALVVLGYGV